jgi:hypothetical protein
MSKSKKMVPVILHLILLLSTVCLWASNVSAATNQFRGVNWADPGDNFQSGIVLPSGLSSSDTNSSAAAVAEAVMSQFISKLGANAVRLPINEATVAKFWSAYTGVIDTIASKGTVILCFWSNAHSAKPADMTAYWNMWKTVVDKYGSNDNVYLEIYNEPNAYSKADLGNLYNSWLTQFATVPKGRVILDGTSMAQNVPDIGSDSRFDGCLLAVHEYSMWGDTSWTTESQWINHFKGYVGNYADRTVCTEWGGPMSPGSKNGVSYGSLDYSQTPSNYFEAYIRGITSQLRTWNMGSFYWVGLKDGDWYSMTTKSGSGSSIALSIPNQSGLERMQYSWTSTPGTGGSDGGTATGGAGGNSGGARDAGADARGSGGTTGTGGVGGGGGASASGGAGGTGTILTGSGGASPGGGASGGSIAGSTGSGGGFASGGRTGSGGVSATGGATGAAGAGGQSSSSSTVASGGAISSGGSTGGTNAGGGGASSSSSPAGGSGVGGASLGFGGATNGSGGNAGSSGESSGPLGCSCSTGRSSGSAEPLVGLLLCLRMLAWQRSRRRT